MWPRMRLSRRNRSYSALLVVPFVIIAAVVSLARADGGDPVGGALATLAAATAQAELARQSQAATVQASNLTRQAQEWNSAATAQAQERDARATRTALESSAAATSTRQAQDERSAAIAATATAQAQLAQEKALKLTAQALDAQYEATRQAQLAQDEQTERDHRQARAEMDLWLAKVLFVAIGLVVIGLVVYLFVRLVASASSAWVRKARPVVTNVVKYTQDIIDGVATEVDVPKIEHVGDQGAIDALNSWWKQHTGNST